VTGISTSSQRRRVGRLRGELADLRPPSRPRLLSDRGDPTLTRLGVQLLAQDWLDQVEEAEALAVASGGVPPVGFTRRLDFERGGVGRLPVDAQLRLARWFAERYVAGGQPRSVAPEPVLPELHLPPPAERVVPASEPPVQEPETVVEDGRRVLRSPPPAGSPSPRHVADLRRNGHRRR
jgi:hypothetical protein